MLTQMCLASDTMSLVVVQHALCLYFISTCMPHCVKKSSEFVRGCRPCPVMNDSHSTELE